MDVKLLPAAIIEQLERSGALKFDELLKQVQKRHEDLSDPELERWVDDRLSFQRFLVFLGNAPDYSTVWQFRERLAMTGTDRLV